MLNFPMKFLTSSSELVAMPKKSSMYLLTRSGLLSPQLVRILISKYPIKRQAYDGPHLCPHSNSPFLSVEFIVEPKRCEVENKLCETYKDIIIGSVRGWVLT